MKKLSFLFVAFALIGFISFSACQSSTAPAEEVVEEVEEVVVEEVVVDSLGEVEEVVIEEVEVVE